MRIPLRSSLLALPLVLLAVSPLAATEWDLAWSDEFNYTGLPDPKKWTYEVGFIRNNEAQYYTKERKENAWVSDGALVIEARKERYRNAGYRPGSTRGRRGEEFADYTSACVTTEGKAAWTYGRIEARAKIPSGRGMWPAIWMLGVDFRSVGWPACGEIDILENVGYAPETVHANVHTKKYNHVKGTGKGSKTKAEKPSEKFHVYAVEWFEDRMDFYVDDRKYFTFKNEGAGPDVWPFDRPQYLILNAAIGGSWGGKKGIDDTIFPQKYTIDYVRVYRQAEEKTPPDEK